MTRTRPCRRGLDGVVGGRQAKVLVSYDNQWAYSSRLADLASLVGGRL